MNPELRNEGGWTKPENWISECAEAIDDYVSQGGGEFYRGNFEDIIREYSREEINRLKKLVLDGIDREEKLATEANRSSCSKATRGTFATCMKIRASNGYQAYLCPGSVSAQEGLPERTGDAVQTSGTRVHAADAGEEIELFADEEDTLETIQSKRERLSAPFREGFESLNVIREKDYLFGYFKGHPDFVEILGNDQQIRAMIFDSKTGWKEQTAPEQNLQLRIYAYLIFNEHPEVGEVVAGLIPSRLKTPLPVLYSRSDLPAIEEQLGDIHAEATKPNAKRIPSDEACRWCRARSTDRCPESIPLNTQLFKTPPELLIKTLTPSQKGQLLDECKLLEGHIKAAREHLYAEIKRNPDAIENYHLVPGDVRGSIPNVDACYQTVSDMLTLEEFQSTLSVKQKALKDAIRDYLGSTEGIKGKAAATRIKALLAPVTVFYKQGKDRLERKA